MAHRQITNIQRYELLEERLGISISSVGAWLEDIGHKFYCNINLEIIALDGGALDHDITILTSVFDENGVIMAIERRSIYKSDFFGICAYKETVELPSSNIELIKIISTKGR